MWYIATWASYIIRDRGPRIQINCINGTLYANFRMSREGYASILQIWEPEATSLRLLTSDCRKNSSRGLLQRYLGDETG